MLQSMGLQRVDTSEQLNNNNNGTIGSTILYIIICVVLHMVQYNIYYIC